MFQVPHYAMFTEAGNFAVDMIVSFATKNNLSWDETYSMLEKLSQQKGCEEATDTAVREYVYEAVFG